MTEGFIVGYVIGLGLLGLLLLRFTVRVARVCPICLGQRTVKARYQEEESHPCPRCSGSGMVKA